MKWIIGTLFVLLILLLSGCPEVFGLNDQGSDDESSDTMLQAFAPIFSSQSDYLEPGSVITIFTITSGATIIYTVDGSDPETSYSSISGEEGAGYAQVFITEDTTVKAVAVKNGYFTSEVSSESYECPLLYLSFEDGSLSEWDDNPGDYTEISVDSTLGANGSGKSLKLDNTIYSGDYENGSISYTIPDSIIPSYISYYVRYQENEETSGAWYAMAVIFHDNADTEESNPVFYSEFECLAEGEGVVEGDMTSTRSINDYNYELTYQTVRNIWYFVEFKNINLSDLSAVTYDFYTNGNYLGQINVSVDDIPCLITLGSDVSPGEGGETQVAWFDELVIK